MNPVLSREQLKGCDRKVIEEWGLPGVVLMENAGRGAAELLTSLGIVGPVVVCCGKGNNGGDGFVMARRLAMSGVDVRVHLFAAPQELAGDAAINFRVLSRCGISVVAHEGTDNGSAFQGELDRAEWIVDALFGFGLSGPVRPPFDRVIAAINASPAKVFAVDIPSGLDADTGRPLGCAVVADHTATMLALKTGFARPEARPFLGRVHLIDIGVSIDRLL
jgi:NAD(P)H-hydrate epimerase